MPSMAPPAIGVVMWVGVAGEGALPQITLHKHAVIHTALPIKKDCVCWFRQRKRSGCVGERGGCRKGEGVGAGSWLGVAAGGASVQRGGDRAEVASGDGGEGQGERGGGGGGGVILRGY